MSTSQGVHAPEPPASASASRETSVVSWASETESAILSYGAAAQTLTQLGDFFRSNPAPPGLSQDDSIYREDYRLSIQLSFTRMLEFIARSDWNDPLEEAAQRTRPPPEPEVQPQQQQQQEQGPSIPLNPPQTPTRRGGDGGDILTPRGPRPDPQTRTDQAAPNPAKAPKAKKPRRPANSARPEGTAPLGPQPPAPQIGPDPAAQNMDVDLDPSQLGPGSGIRPIQPRAQRANRIPYQPPPPISSTGKGLPRSPKDTNAKPKKAETFVVVARRNKTKKPPPQLTQAETAAILARARPDVPPQAIAKIAAANTAPRGAPGPSAPKGKKKEGPRKPANMTTGPNRRQVYVLLNPGVPAPDLDVDQTVRDINDVLRTYNHTLRLVSGFRMANGWHFSAIDVPTDKDIDRIRGFFSVRYTHTIGDKLWVGVPSSRSFLMIVGVPVHNKYTGGLTVPDDILRAMQGHLYRHSFSLAAPLRPSKESPNSTRMTVFFDIWDSQQGSRARTLNDARIIINSTECFVKPAPARHVVPLCPSCWRWGHSRPSCRGRTRCPKCGEPHTLEEHRQHASCCKENAKIKQTATPADAPCPHTFRCLNCRRDTHHAHERKCVFWESRHDPAKIKALNEQVSAYRKRSLPNTNSRRP